MAALSLTILSPLADYLEASSSGSKLAARPASLEGKVLALLPNWRPHSAHILQGIGAALAERFRLKAVVLEEGMKDRPRTTGKVLDAYRDKLDDLARRVDVVITGTGD